jgi:oligopeptide/dipeptide ABC transporter ATP-binding protein
LLIARARAASPRVVVADEPVSALDVSVQAQILNLFRDLQEQQDLGCLFVSHDLAVVGFVADSVVVMYRGEVVETGSAIEVLESPVHPYTVALRAAAHMEKADDPSPVAEVPGSEAAEIGCPYVDRCPLAMARCRIEKPALRDLGAGRTAACFALEVS